MFNLWRAYPKKKPEIGGDYLCTVLDDNGYSVEILRYNARYDKWTDEMVNLENDVVAWKRLSKHYGWWKVGGKR